MDELGLGEGLGDGLGDGVGGGLGDGDVLLGGQVFKSGALASIQSL